MAASSSLTLFEDALFRFWPKASGHRSLGHRPRAAKKQTVYWPEAMFTRYALSVNMAFGQTRPIAHDSWGDAQATVINGRWPMLDCKVCIFKTHASGWYRNHPP